MPSTQLYKAYGVEIAPLSDYVSYDPDVVIMITNPYNAMRITQGYAYHNGPIKNFNLMECKHFAKNVQHVLLKIMR